MDPVTITIVSALAAGAAAGASQVATTAIRDGYAGLKRLIIDRYQQTGPFANAVEADPTSEPEQEVLAKQLARAGAQRDEELKAAAQLLLNELESLRSEPRAAALFDFGKLRAAKNFELEDIRATGTVLRADEATFEGDFKARKIDQTSQDRSSKHSR